MKNLEQWIRVDQELPRKGVLCVTYFPMVKHYVPRERTSGPIAMAYYREGVGWIYADEPTPLRFEPAYWREYNEI